MLRRSRLTGDNVFYRLLKLTTDRLEASRGFSATAELLIIHLYDDCYCRLQPIVLTL